MNNPTPWPWEITEVPFEDGRGWIIEDAQGHFIGDAPIEANAQLMASSPDMLKALEALNAGPKEQLDFLHDLGLQAPNTRYGNSQEPGEAYQLTNEFEADARGIYPALDNLALAVSRAAIAQARGQEVAS